MKSNQESRKPGTSDDKSAEGAAHQGETPPSRYDLDDMVEAAVDVPPHEPAAGRRSPADDEDLG